ncbi:MAG: uncharacterized protein QG670_1748 [Thermoproteota archaeon]|nr:uncharacterized protein [Thermoproteota archaeon]
MFKFTSTIERLYIGQDRIPVLLFYKEGSSKPVVFCQHGLLGDKRYTLSTCLRLADSGFLAISMDARDHGERMESRFWQRLRMNMPSFFFPILLGTAKDVGKVIDYLEERVEADVERVGMMGVSMGGFITVLSVTLEERIKAAVSVLAGANYGILMRRQLQEKGLNETLGLANESFTDFDEHSKEFVEDYDPINHVNRFRPIPLLLLNRERDHLVPLECATSLYDALQPTYKKTLDKLRLKVYPGVAHEYSQEMEMEVIEWFKVNL